MTHLGVNLIPETDTDTIVRLAVEAEQLGFTRCRVYDEGIVTRDVHVVMTAIAEATERVMIGPGITNPYTRHPAQTASAIASLDEVSQGRAFLGIGAGGSLALDPVGIERSSPLRAVRETIEVNRALYSGEPVDYDGEFVTLRSARLGYGRPDIEIWLAGRGPKILRLGGRLADGVMLDFLHRDTIGASVELVRAAGREVGRVSRICYSTVLVTDDDDLEFVRPHMTYRLVDSPAPVKAAIGLTEADASRIRTAMAGGLEAAAEHVRDEWVLPFVIQGTAAECRATLDNLIDEHDIDEFLLPMFDMDDQSGYLRRVARTLLA
jgi:5,10-methylenetetrahydromethanopterin reductase